MENNLTVLFCLIDGFCKKFMPFWKLSMVQSHLKLAADTTAANKFFLDGKELAANTVPLINDSQEHTIEVKMQ